MATNMTLHFEGPAIKGADQIEVLAWDHGISPGGSRSGGGDSPRNVFNFSKYMDAGSTELMRLCWSGQQFQKATVRCYRSDGMTDNKPVEYLRITMQNVAIADVSVSGAGGGVPVENIRLEYGTLGYTYTDHKLAASSVSSPPA